MSEHTPEQIADAIEIIGMCKPIDSIEQLADSAISVAQAALASLKESAR